MHIALPGVFQLCGGLFNLSGQILIAFKFLRANFKQLTYTFFIIFNKDLFAFCFLNSHLVSEFSYFFFAFLPSLCSHGLETKRNSSSWKMINVMSNSSNVVYKWREADFIMWLFSFPPFCFEPFYYPLTSQLYGQPRPAWYWQWLQQWLMWRLNC